MPSWISRARRRRSSTVATARTSPNSTADSSRSASSSQRTLDVLERRPWDASSGRRRRRRRWRASRRRGAGTSGAGALALPCGLRLLHRRAAGPSRARRSESSPVAMTLRRRRGVATTTGLADSLRRSSAARLPPSASIAVASTSSETTSMSRPPGSSRVMVRSWPSSRCADAYGDIDGVALDQPAAGGSRRRAGRRRSRSSATGWRDRGQAGPPPRSCAWMASSATLCDADDGRIDAKMPLRRPASRAGRGDVDDERVGRRARRPAPDVSANDALGDRGRRGSPCVIGPSMIAQPDHRQRRARMSRIRVPADWTGVGREGGDDEAGEQTERACADVDAGAERSRPHRVPSDAAQSPIVRG